MSNSVESSVIEHYMQQLTNQARGAAQQIAQASTHAKNNALMAMAEQLQQQSDDLLAANEQDLAAGREAGLDEALLDRLALDESRIHAMAEGLRQIAALPDPVGEVSDLNYRPSGIQVGRMRVPLGVIGMIYESRPNVTADAAGLCLKSGNAVILRGGSEAFHSNQAIAQLLSQGMTEAGLNPHTVQLVAHRDRQAVGRLITSHQVDLIIPRGGRGLIERISREATVPVLKHLDGICHVYLDQGCDEAMALAITLNAKTHRYGVCNAMETLLIHREVAADLLSEIADALLAKGVELRGCPLSCELDNRLQAANEQDWATEYLAPILSIRVVEDFAQAVDHISRYGSGHTEAIVTQDYQRAQNFIRQVDASSVMVNASTRFADGFEYGLGAEIGISTDRLHARGPVGLQGLTTQKYIVLGNGQIRG